MIEFSQPLGTVYLLDSQRWVLQQATGQLLRAAKFYRMANFERKSKNTQHDGFLVSGGHFNLTTKKIDATVHIF